jgi:hypothetical protein
MKLVFAAPASGLPSLPIALGSHASRVHFATKLFSAAPARGLPFLPIAWLWHALSAIAAELSANVIRRAAKPIRFILNLHSLVEEADSGCSIIDNFTITWRDMEGWCLKWPEAAWEGLGGVSRCRW